MTLDRAIIGDCRAVLPTLDAESVQCVVTSPPYWGLRDYGCDGQLGLESTPEEYVANLVAVFREVWRVLRSDGVVWLNLGDSYITNRGQASRGENSGASSTLEGLRQRGGGPRLKAMKVKGVTPRRAVGRPISEASTLRNGGPPLPTEKKRRLLGRPAVNGRGESQVVPHSVDPKSGVERIGERPNRAGVFPPGLKHKDMALIPARVSLAMQVDGWWVRDRVIWAKPAPMPESVTDRTTKAHEDVLMLTKADRYFYDAKAIAEPAVSDHVSGNKARKYRQDHGGLIGDARHQAHAVPWLDLGGTRNARSVWTIAGSPYDGAHFAVMPPELAQRCILAGSRIGDTVLDPFMGSGTVGMVAEGLGRHWLGIELNPEYGALIGERTAQRGLLTGVAR